jgi:hypothetical protein
VSELDVVPILKRHYAIVVIKKEVKTRSKKMTLEEVSTFLNFFKSDFWRDFAEFQFYMAARGQEVVRRRRENLYRCTQGPQ